MFWNELFFRLLVESIRFEPGQIARCIFKSRTDFKLSSQELNKLDWFGTWLRYLSNQIASSCPTHDYVTSITQILHNVAQINPAMTVIYSLKVFSFKFSMRVLPRPWLDNKVHFTEFCHIKNYSGTMCRRISLYLLCECSYKLFT